MSFKHVFKEDREPLTYRHAVLGVIWAVTLIPMVLCVLGGAAAEKMDNGFGHCRRWANPHSYHRFDDGPSP